MNEKIFWLFFLLILGGIFLIGYAVFSLKKREIQTYLPGMLETSFELDSKETWRVVYFWKYIFACFGVGITCVIVGLYGLFFV